MSIECGGFTFTSNFDSGNIDRVELVSQNDTGEPTPEKSTPSYEFNIWTKVDCFGTEFANNNKSWFYFGITGGTPCTDVKLNVVNLNKHGKLYEQGMAPVMKTIPAPNHWERVRERLSFDLKQNLLSFGYRTLENLCSTTYFAFTYPYSFVDLQNTFKQHDLLLKKFIINRNPIERDADDIYYHRECVIMSLEGRPVYLITISSHHGITTEQEPRLRKLFPESTVQRPHVFKNKKESCMREMSNHFLSVKYDFARVHPGETPSSFVMNGVLNTLLNKNDPVATILRKTFVFKLMPMLNPDGVSNGFYRTDTRGVNLNRLYLNPSSTLHPSIFAARALILYYHYGHEISEESLEQLEIDNVCEAKPFDVTYFSSSTKSAASPTTNNFTINSESLEFLTDAPSVSSPLSVHESSSTHEDDDVKVASDTENLNDKVAEISMAEERHIIPGTSTTNVEVSSSLPKLSSISPNGDKSNTCKKLLETRQLSKSAIEGKMRQVDSGLYLYVDFHGHASKRGIFMFGNHFDNVNDKVECMLLPKLLSLNNSNFHYNQCNFSKRNMYTRGRRDGLSKEGCGRVAVLKFTGLIKSYTLECNYNTGCIVNIIPPTQKPLGKPIVHPVLVPPKYTPQIYEEVGRALCVSILDLIGCNPNSRLHLSQFKTIAGLKESLRSEALLAKSLQSQQKLNMRQSIAVMQRGNNKANKNYATNNRKFLSLKRQSGPSTAERKESLGMASLGSSKGDRSNSNTTSILHPLNKCGILTNTTINSLMKKQGRVGKLPSNPKKKNVLLKKKKVFEGPTKLEKEVRQNRSEFFGWNTIKRKIEKKSSPSGNANPSARPPNKKRKKSKIL